MNREHGARREDEEVADRATGAVGKRNLVASRYPALTGRGADDKPTIHDVATAAVEHKGCGAAIDPGVADRVGTHLGVDFSGVRLHSDPLTQQATAAMRARAFAYGKDVFLGAGESGGDVGLMAHELTHVAQQGAAGQRAVQRAVQVGDADSPAEREADQVAAAVTGGQAQSTWLLVDDGPVRPGQMLKSQFLEQLRAEVTAAADAELGPIYSAIGCPYIEQYFGRYAGQPASSGEALLRRFAPATRTARAAADMIPAVVARVREGARQWRDTGQAPADLAAMAPTAAGPGAAASVGGGPAPAQAQVLRAPDGGETLASLEAELGPGQALDGATASRMSDALGIDVSSARVHTGAVAARKAADAGALAFAVGPNVVMGARAPGAGTLEGDALLAHELAHTAQQAGASSDSSARRQPIGAGSSAAEDHADAAAAGALAQLHGGASGGLVQRIGGAFKTGLQLQRCTERQHQQAPIQLAALPAAITAPVQVIAPFGTFTVVPDATTGALGLNQMRVREIRALERGWNNILAGRGIVTNGSAGDVAAWRRMVQQAMSDSPTLRRLITDIGNDPDARHAITANLGRSQPGVLVDSFGTGDVDLDDLDHFPAAPSALNPNEMTLGEQIVHILAERRAAQTSANPADFDPAHATATAAHNQYRAERGQPAEISAVAAPTAGGGLRGTTRYTDGTSQDVEFDANGNIVGMRKP